MEHGKQTKGRPKKKWIDNIPEDCAARNITKGRPKKKWIDNIPEDCAARNITVSSSRTCTGLIQVEEHCPSIGTAGAQGFCHCRQLSQTLRVW